MSDGAARIVLSPASLLPSLFTARPEARARLRDSIMRNESCPPACSPWRRGAGFGRHQAREG